MVHMNYCEYIQKDSYLIDKTSINIYFLISQITCMQKNLKTKSKINKWRLSFQIPIKHVLLQGCFPSKSQWDCSFAEPNALQHNRQFFSQLFIHHFHGYKSEVKKLILHVFNLSVQEEHRPHAQTFLKPKLSFHRLLQWQEINEKKAITSKSKTLFSF